MKSLQIVLIIIVLLGVGSVSAQDGDTPTPLSTGLQRPTVLSTGLPSIQEDTPVPPPPRTEIPRSATPAASDTIEPSATSSASATPIDTRTATATASDTTTPTNTATITPSATATRTPTPTFTPSHTPTATETPKPISVIAGQPTDENSANSLSPLLIGGILLLIAIALYATLYAMNATALDRYATGFIVSTCPACEIGNLNIEERPYRSVGLPRLRRTVRCDNCRSTLREVGRFRWRYSVDPLVNDALFADYNGEIITENELRDKAQGLVSYTDSVEYVDRDM